MATRVPPSHAPAWGRRAKEIDSTSSTPAGSTTKTSVATNALGEQNKSEERIRRRRFSDEETRIHRGERQERETVEQDRVRDRIPMARDRRVSGAFSFVWPPDSPGYEALQRVLGAVERATDLLLRGQGHDAAIVMSHEASRARNAALAISHMEPEARVLTGVAANLSARAEALSTTTPLDAEKWAARLERVALATSSRAAALERPGDARLLGALASDTRAQAVLLAAAAANTDVLLARGLLKALERIADTSMSMNSPLHPHSADRVAIGKAFASLDRSVVQDRSSLHSLTLPAVLKDHPLLRNLIPSFLDLSRAFASGDVPRINDARAAIVETLQKNHQLPLLEEMLGQQKLPNAPSLVAEQLSQRALPLLMLRGICSGGLGALAKESSPIGLNAWLKKVEAPELLDQLSPSERILADMMHGRIDSTPVGRGEGPQQKKAWGPVGLGGPDALLLGSHSLFNASGVVTQFLASHPTPLATLATAADPIGPRLASIGAGGPAEVAAFADAQGGALVRTTSGGVEWHQGFFNGVDGSRTYFDVNSFGGFDQVRFQSAADEARALARLDVQIGRVSEDVEAIEDDAPEKKKQRPQIAGRTDLAAIVLDAPGPSFGAFLGVLPKHAAAAFAEHLELAQPAPIEAFYSPASTLLSSHGHPRGAELQEKIVEQLITLGLSPKDVAVLVLSCDETTAAVLLGSAAFVPFDGAPALPVDPPKDRLREPSLAREGVLVLPTHIILE